MSSIRDLWDMIYSVMKTAQPVDLLDILVLSYIVYFVIKLIRETRAGQLMKGIFLLLIAFILAKWLNMKAITYLLTQTFNVGLLALLIMFQPELRRALEKAGHTKIGLRLGLNNSTGDQAVWGPAIEVVCDACVELSATMTGALIVLERQTRLGEQIDNGTILNADPSKELFGNIFYNKTPLHDGAVIIQGNKIACAAAYFPPTTKDLPSKYGARHRAAVGISEITDSITIIVSEETGNISVAVNGQLTQYPPEGLQRYLTNMLVQSSNQNPSSILVPMLNQAKSMSKRAKKQEEDINKDERVKAIEIVNLIEQKKEGSQHGISK